MKPFNTRASTEVLLTPKQFANLNDEQRENIKTCTIIPPKLGDKHFGKIKITRKTPGYALGKNKNKPPDQEE